MYTGKERPGPRGSQVIIEVKKVRFLKMLESYLLLNIIDDEWNKLSNPIVSAGSKEKL